MWARSAGVGDSRDLRGVLGRVWTWVKRWVKLVVKRERVKGRAVGVW